jgi:hypothetical protein
MAFEPRKYHDISLLIIYFITVKLHYKPLKKDGQIDHVRFSMDLIIEL